MIPELIRFGCAQGGLRLKEDLDFVFRRVVPPGIRILVAHALFLVAEK